eukprot:GHVH01016944.1.p1 GENE.GHVH01016944.1~~GHVH01016944.1.p1  ORF type:complete len:921 (-),score=115.65 GHVH01016944.1:4358-7120(-)
MQFKVKFRSSKVPAISRSEAFDYYGIIRDLCQRQGYYHTVISSRLLRDRRDLEYLRWKRGSEAISYYPYHHQNDSWIPYKDADGRVRLIPPLPRQDLAAYDAWWWRLSGLVDDRNYSIPPDLLNRNVEKKDGDLDTAMSSTRDFIESFCVNMAVPHPQPSPVETSICSSIMDCERDEHLHSIPITPTTYFCTSAWLNPPRDNQLNIHEDLRVHVLPFVHPYEMPGQNLRSIAVQQNDHILKCLFDKSYLYIIMERSPEPPARTILVLRYRCNLNSFTLYSSDNILTMIEPLLHITADIYYHTSSPLQDGFELNELNRNICTLQLVVNNKCYQFGLPGMTPCCKTYQIDRHVLMVLSKPLPKGSRFPFYCEYGRRTIDLGTDTLIVAPYSLGRVTAIVSQIQCLGQFNINNMNYPFTSASDVLGLEAHLKPYQNWIDYPETSSELVVLVKRGSASMIAVPWSPEDGFVMDGRSDVLNMECLSYDDDTINIVSTSFLHDDLIRATRFQVSHEFSFNDVIKVEYCAHQSWVLLIASDRVMAMELKLCEESSEVVYLSLSRVQVFEFSAIMPSPMNIVDTVQWTIRSPDAVNLYVSPLGSPVLALVLSHRNGTRVVNYYDFVTGTAHMSDVELSGTADHGAVHGVAVSASGRSSVVYDERCITYKVTAYCLKESLTPDIESMRPSKVRVPTVQIDENCGVHPRVEGRLEFSDDSEEDLGPAKRSANLQEAMRRSCLRVVEYHMSKETIRKKQARARKERRRQGNFVHEPCHKNGRKSRRNEKHWQQKLQAIVEFEKPSLDEMRSLSLPMKHSVVNRTLAARTDKASVPLMLPEFFWLQQPEYPRVNPFATKRQSYVNWDRALSSFIAQPFRPMTNDRNMFSFNQGGLEFAVNLAKRHRPKSTDTLYRSQLYASWLADQCSQNFE